MMYLQQGNRVYYRQEIQTKSQMVVQETFYDMTYHTELSYSNGKVTATIYNYLNELQGNYSDSITFDYDGTTVTVTPVNGVATIDFTSTVPGEHIVKTVNPNMRNGEVKIYV